MFPPDPWWLAGLSLSWTLPARCWAGGVAACAGAGLADAEMDKVEFFRVAAPARLVELPMLALFFADRVLVPLTGTVAPEPRLRFLITSVFKLNGLTTPCNLRNRPQALHSG